MKSKPSFAQLPAFLAISLLMFAAPLAQSADPKPTDLATAPISGSSATNLSPNIMFVLDESGSMDWNFLPDWAGGKNNYSTLPKYRLAIDVSQSNNSRFNGVAYNPAITYSPPIYYLSSGALDTETYPSQTSAKTTGWTKVKNNPYKNNTTVNLLDPAFRGLDPAVPEIPLVYFTTIAGEYCKNSGMRDCSTSSDAPYVVPAPLRWCNAQADAYGAMPGSGKCQAVEKDNSEDKAFFAYPRMPWPLVSTLTITSPSVVSSITVDSGKSILSASVPAQTDTTAQAIAIQNAINACAFAVTGHCTTSGYRALANGSTVTIYAQTTVSAAPVITTGTLGALSATAFTSKNTNYLTSTLDPDPKPSNVAGFNVPTLISPVTPLYPKATKRTDCTADATGCTYEEEMTNYANWWSYYRTRMQTMKTAASRAFASLGDTYRVGFNSVNNQTGDSAKMGDLFLNIATFDHAQKLAWYNKLFSATPTGETPLRLALAQTGRIFAGQLKGVFNRQTINDPVEQSCQQNVTILSTDGYWNKEAGVQINGTSAVGHQDSLAGVVRPQLDGGLPSWESSTVKMVKTTTPTKRPQVRISRTSAPQYQLQSSEKSVLQKQTSKLQQQNYRLQKTTYDVYSETANLMTQSKNVQQRTYTNVIYTKWAKKITQLVKITGIPQAHQKTYHLQSTTTPLNQQTNPVQNKIGILKRTPYQLKQTSHQLQKMVPQQVEQRIGNGGPWSKVDVCEMSSKSQVVCRITRSSTWVDVPDWDNATNTAGKCVVVTENTTGGTRTDDGGVRYGANTDSDRTVYTTTTSCQYKTSEGATADSCTATMDAAPLPSGNTYSPASATTCAYDTAAQAAAKEVTATATCTTGSSNFINNANGSKTYKAYDTCRYDTAQWATQQTGTCSKVPESSGPTYTTLKAIDCKYAGWGDYVSIPGNCAFAAINTDPSKPYSLGVNCSYGTQGNPIRVSSCTPQTSNQADGSGYFWPQVLCSYTNPTASPDLITVPLTGEGACSETQTPAGCNKTGTPYCSSYVTCSPANDTIGKTEPVATCEPDAANNITCGTSVVLDWTATTDGTCTVDGSVTALPDGSTIYCKATGNDDENGACTEGNPCGLGWTIWSVVSSCTPRNVAPVGTNPYGDGTVQCRYAPEGFNTWANASSICTPRADDVLTNPAITVYPAVNCKYNSYGNLQPDAWCVGKTQPALVTTGSNLTTATSLLQAKKCSYPVTTSGPTLLTAAGDSCTPIAKPAGTAAAPFVATAVDCSYKVATAYSDVTSGACLRNDLPTYGTLVPGTKYEQLTGTDCRYLDSGWANVVAPATCEEAGTKCELQGGAANGTSCSNYSVTQCQTAGWTDWTNVNEGSCTVNGNNYDHSNSSYVALYATGTKRCRYVAAPTPTKYFVPASACQAAVTPGISNYPTPLASGACTTMYGLGTYNSSSGEIAYWDTSYSEYSWADSPAVYGTPPPLGTRLSSVTHPYYKWTMQSKHLPPTSLPASSASEIYSLDYRSIAPSGGTTTETVDPTSCVATTDDGTAQANKVVCTSTPSGPVPGTACTPAAASAANSWVETKCTEVSGQPTADTLADVAQYYYMTDLRTPLPGLGNCVGALGSGVDVCANNAIPSGTDTATWQHMTTYTLGLGASGYMQYQDDYPTALSGDYFSVATGQKADLANGVCSWVSDGATCNWPTPASNTQTNIDDLWHAAVNGRGVYYSAGDPASLASGLSSALKSIDAKDGARAAVTFSSRNLRAEGNNLVFYSSFTAGAWVGELTARKIDQYGVIDDDYCQKTVAAVTTRLASCPNVTPLPAGVTKVTVPPVWRAQAQLDALPWASRKLFTFSAPGVSKPFAWEEGGLTEEEKAYFLPAPETAISLSQFCTTGDNCLSEAQQELAKGKPLVDFLRGERTNENSSSEEKYYRQRTHLLGDLVNADPVYVQAPLFAYADKGYWDFKAAQTNRTPMVYAAANDGMLHAFYVKTDPDALQPTVGGQEAWAYIPRLVLPVLHRLADKNYKSMHQFSVDGTPVVGDICVSNCSRSDSTPAVWKTILVGGLNHGGKGYYALDITDPANPLPLWEFSDANLGYSYGNPVITKQADGTWSVLFASGYNNADGEGRLFVLNAKTGEAIGSPISTNVGSLAEPSGLAKIAGWADYPNNDNTTLRVYGGDLLGNLWRITLGATTPETPAVQLLAVLKDATDKVQPITARPELAVAKKSGKPYPLVLVGTGSLLGTTDMSSKTQQSFYGILDTLGYNSLGALHLDLRSNSSFVTRIMSSAICPEDATNCTPGKPVYSISDGQEVNLNIDTNTHNGWLIDFMTLGERANTNPLLIRGTLLFNSNTPSAEACVAGGTSNSYYLNAMTGGAIKADGVIGSYLGPLASNINAAVTSDGGIVTGTMTDDNKHHEGNPPISSTPEGSRRVSWRELISE